MPQDCQLTDVGRLEKMLFIGRNAEKKIKETCIKCDGIVLSVTTYLENLEKSENCEVVTEKLGKCGKVRENRNQFLQVRKGKCVK